MQINVAISSSRNQPRRLLRPLEIQKQKPNPINVGKAVEMATSAFRSTTKRSSITGGGGGGGSEGGHRRSRSLSRGPIRFQPPSPPESGELPMPRRRFVNTVRGTGFPEVSLDDVADELHANGVVSDGRRGRSASRNGLRRQRSVSVARYRAGNCESEMDCSHSSASQTKSKCANNGNSQHKLASSNVLRRSMSQKDLQRSHDGYSSQSSTITDDEAHCADVNKVVTEKTIQAIYSQKKNEHPIGDGGGNGLYEVMRKEVRHAVEEIRTELEKVMAKTEPIAIVDDDGCKIEGSHVIQTISDIRRSYREKLEESEKRRQDLLAELAVEEQRGLQLSKVVRELLPTPKQSATPERQLRSRERSNDRSRISKCLTEEAEKYFEDFLSNVEDTDISSYDGERSDTSSSLRDCRNLRDNGVPNIIVEAHDILRKAASASTETDGVVLPWLQWETSNDCSLSTCKSKTETVGLGDNAMTKEPSAPSISSSLLSSPQWNRIPEGYGSPVSKGVTLSQFGELGSSSNMPPVERLRRASFNVDEYVQLQCDEDLLFERWRQRQRIGSGNLILCGRTSI